MSVHDNVSGQHEKSTRLIKVGYITRVEGEGSLSIQTDGNIVKRVHLKIFEPPRFFEALLRGRSFWEAPDITSRICGICPVAYQMSAVHAIEKALELTIPDSIRQLRRLLYCGEWIESHVLHIFLLHAPDFLGYPDAISLAKAQKHKLEMGLRLKKLGNRIMALLGGREIHPINVKVGGFYKIPLRTDLLALTEELCWAEDAAWETLRWVSTFSFPDCAFDVEYIALQHAADYPMNEGAIVSNKGLNIEASAFEQNFEEYQVPHSTALHSRRIGHGFYLTGPMARFCLNFDRLPESIQTASVSAGVPRTCTNPYRSIQIRAMEVIYACQEAHRIIQVYRDSSLSSVEVMPRAAIGRAATEAPRGLLYHRYEIDAEGNILSARIVPPTSQNQGQIEVDLGQIVANHLELSDQALTSLCENFIRNYDPCISCATHFLSLKRERL